MQSLGLDGFLESWETWCLESIWNNVYFKISLNLYRLLMDIDFLFQKTAVQPGKKNLVLTLGIT